MVTHGIYSVRELYSPHQIKNTKLNKECPKCAYVHDEVYCLNCHLKR